MNKGARATIMNLCRAN